jgi:hypothetical protein
MVHKFRHLLVASAICLAPGLALAQPPLPKRLPVVPAQQAERWQDVGGTRFIPPKIMALLNDPRVAPTTRFFLQGVAAKPTEDWTLQEYTTTVQLIPTLTEMYIATATLSDLYEFLGLDPTSLFEPHLGHWSTRAIGFDVKNLGATEQAECFARLGYGENIDPTQVTLKAITTCTGDDE